MNDIDQLVQQVVNSVTTMAKHASRFASRLAIGAIVICVGGFLLGVAALSGGILKVWIVLGVGFGAIAIGSALIAWWRVGSIKRHVPELANEIRSMVSRGKDTGQGVIDTFAVQDDDGNTVYTADMNAGSAVGFGRQMWNFKGIVGDGAQSMSRMTAATTAITSFPLLALATVAISMVFGFLGVIFLISLAL